MGSLFKQPKGPKAPAIPIPPPAAAPPTMASADVAASIANAKTRAASAAGAGFNDTIATSPEGVTTPALTTNATLLGGGPAKK